MTDAQRILDTLIKEIRDIDITQTDDALRADMAYLQGLAKGIQISQGATPE